MPLPRAQAAATESIWRRPPEPSVAGARGPRRSLRSRCTGRRPRRPGQPGDRRASQRLALRSRHVDARRETHRLAAEAHRARQPGERFPGGAALDELRQSRRVRSCRGKELAPAPRSAAMHPARRSSAVTRARLAAGTPAPVVPRALGMGRRIGRAPRLCSAMGGQAPHRRRPVTPRRSGTVLRPTSKLSPKGPAARRPRANGFSPAPRGDRGRVKAPHVAGRVHRGRGQYLIVPAGAGDADRGVPDGKGRDRSQGGAAGHRRAPALPVFGDGAVLLCFFTAQARRRGDHAGQGEACSRPSRRSRTGPGNGTSTAAWRCATTSGSMSGTIAGSSAGRARPRTTSTGIC